MFGTTLLLGGVWRARALEARALQLAPRALELARERRRACLQILRACRHRAQARALRILLRQLLAQVADLPPEELLLLLPQLRAATAATAPDLR